MSFLLVILFCACKVYGINYIGSYALPISYNTRIDDIDFQNAIELSFQIRLTTPCSAPTSYPYCHIMKIGSSNQNYPRLPLLYTKSGDPQIRSVFTTSDGKYSPDYLNNINVYDGYYHNIYIKYSPSQIVITADNTVLVNDTNGRMIASQYQNTQYSIYLADNVGTTASGYIRYLDINTWTESQPDITIRNHQDIQQWWVAFYLNNIDLTTCGGIITNAEITDNANYNGIWARWNQTKYNLWGHFAFDNQGYQFTPPVTIRLTKSSPYESLILPNIITSFTGNDQYDSGDNFCRTDSPTTATDSPSISPTISPSINPTRLPTMTSETYIPTKNQSQRPSYIPTSSPTISIQELNGESENVFQSTEVVLSESEADFVSKFLIYIIVGGVCLWSLVIGIIIYCKCCLKKHDTNEKQTNTTIAIQNNTNTPGRDGPIDTNTVTIKIQNKLNRNTPGGPNGHLRLNTYPNHSIRQNMQSGIILLVSSKTSNNI